MIPNWDNIATPAIADPVGTVRLCDRFGTISVYIKVAENTWRTIYVDPVRHEHLIPPTMISDNTAGCYRVVYSPKTVGTQGQ